MLFFSLPYSIRCGLKESPEFLNSFEDVFFFWIQQCVIRLCHENLKLCTFKSFLLQQKNHSETLEKFLQVIQHMQKSVAIAFETLIYYEQLSCQVPNFLSLQKLQMTVMKLVCFFLQIYFYWLPPFSSHNFNNQSSLLLKLNDFSCTQILLLQMSCG